MSVARGVHSLSPFLIRILLVSKITVITFREEQRHTCMCAERWLQEIGSGWWWRSDAGGFLKSNEGWIIHVQGGGGVHNVVYLLIDLVKNTCRVSQNVFQTLHAFGWTFFSQSKHCMGLFVTNMDILDINEQCHWKNSLRQMIMHVYKVMLPSLTFLNFSIIANIV